MVASDVISDLKRGAKHGFLPKLLKYSQQLKEYPRKRQKDSGRLGLNVKGSFVASPF